MREIGETTPVAGKNKLDPAILEVDYKGVSSWKGRLGRGVAWRGLRVAPHRLARPGDG